jgi:pimeloyl-ACP methyl ester carboxylesterase
MRWILSLLLVLAASGAVAEEPQPPFFTARDCPAGKALPEGIAAECGTVTVLEDRTRPDGPRIALAVATLWRTGQDLAPDPLLFIQGGPGLPTHLGPGDLGVWAGMVKSREWPGRQRLVLFDQRGVGASQILPTGCSPLDPNAVNRTVDHLQPPREAWLADLRRSAEECWARYRDSGHDPGNITTATIAADVADLRLALGYPGWNLWGMSFGSRVALTVMRDHPEGVRSVIVEGVAPPEANLIRDHVADLGSAFDALVGTCRADADCDAAYPDLERRFFALAAALDAHPRIAPVTVPDEPAVMARIDGWSLRDVTFQMLGSPERSRFLPLLVAEAEAGNMRLLDSMKTWQVLVAEIEQEDLASDVYASVICADLLPTESDWADRARSQDPRFADQIWNPGSDGACAAWPVARSPAGDAAPVTSAIPTLLISGAFDPITPPGRAEAAAKRLANGHSYVFPGQGHGVLIRGQPCARRIANRFLDDPGSRPDDECFTSLAPPIFEPPSRRP